VHPTADEPVDPTPSGSTAWPVVYALAGLQAVVTLGWMAYAYFQAPLLERFGFTALSGPLALYLGLAGTTLAPFVGWIGDRLASRRDGRTSLMVTGGLLAGATFVAVAATVGVDPAGTLRWALLGFIALWIAAMTVLQAPALSLLPATTTATRWPLVTSPLVVATLLPTACWPWVHRALDTLGGPQVFLAGGLAVVAATLALRRAADRGRPAAPPSPSADPTPVVETHLGPAAAAFAVGGVSAALTRLAGEVVPNTLALRLTEGTASAEALSAVIVGTGALLAPTLAPIAVAVGARVGLVTSLLGAALCAVAAPLCGSILTAAAVGVTMGVALALYLDCALPCAFEVLPHRRLGLSAGLYLGGVFAGSQLAALAL